jgi:hypothetical protein
MDTVLGIFIVAVVLGFIFWLVSKSSASSPSSQRGGDSPALSQARGEVLRRRAAGIAFLLEEAQRRSELSDAIPEPQRRELIRRYERSWLISLPR